MKQSLLLAAVAVALLAQPLVARAAGVQGSHGVFGQQPAPYTLSFFNTHTHEKATVTYRQMGMPVSTEIGKIEKLMIDHRSGKVHTVNPELLDLLYDIKLEIQRRHPGQDVTFHIISGYRAPESNAAMRRAGGGQAKNSRHMHGDAMDIRVPGVKTAEIRDIAWCLQKGGVGMYTGSDFVHVDVWKVRHWNWAPTAGTCKNDPTS
jgi:uncharacterized protein YcbK (DUF882 family)